MAAPLSPIARSSPLRTPLSSTSRSHLPFMAVSGAAASSSTSAEAEQDISRGRGVTKEAPIPQLEVIGSKSALLSQFASLKMSYRPFPVIGWNRHVETIFAAFFRSLPRVQFRRECLRTRDDGAVALDWVSGDERRLSPDTPVLVLLPGLTGGSQDTYVRHMLVRARKKGWRVVVFNSRGCANSPVTTPQFYSASFTEDLCEVVKHVSKCYPKCKIYAVGWSLGANILVRYLGQESYGCPLAGAVSLCNPFNLPIADEDFRKGFNKIYDNALARSLKKIFKRHELLFVGLHDEYNIPMAANARTVREFDEGLTRVSFGFKSVDDYYFNSSSSNSIVHVQTPLLCIQAANDPIAPSRGIPREKIKENPNCLLIVTPKGGHLGWVAGEEAPFGAPWTDSVVMEFLEHLHHERPATSSNSSSEIDGVQQPLSSISVQT
ncbi:embryogenesis-associated protein EMB8 [Dendrobium catenatum]|uniref:Embryogenesis-associated protein EMB8 n=1 Tax=Dendrobium catenatum TaxID=906689 RepID=A0A2I0VXU7_9ASPA|nr:embryogenesis-associated protein EMB8 [Dendrobium catenatum]PKU68209.1 Embryogenesis-associated protein EMB8 [Dendrobium catenatum]